MKRFFQVTALAVCLASCLTACGVKRDKGNALPADAYKGHQVSVKEGIFIGDTSISEYTIIYSSKRLLSICEELQSYIEMTSKEVVPVKSKRQAFEDIISLSLDSDMPKDEGQITIESGDIFIKAGSKETLEKYVYLFIDTYLGWIKSGTEEAYISNPVSTLHIPENMEIVENPWMEEREAIITLWNVNYARGTYLDSDVSLKNNVIDFSEAQLYEYVKMLKYCGFTGIQVTEMCSTWAGVGSIDACHEKMRILADAAHSLDMKFTLWVWGAEFADNGWVDDEVTFEYLNGDYTFNNPASLACFEKYYDIYAQLAPYCDRVIGHYYDPGNVYTKEEIAFYAKMLRDKFLAVNPDIDFGLSCWVDVYDKTYFIEELGADVTLYERGQRDEEETYVNFRTQMRDFGCRLGTWAWNTCEMEIDQLAQMNFNMEIIRSVYQTARKYDYIAKPTYWSEMDSYHVLNVFSLFCAGQLLQNPDMESELLYEKISTAAVGPEYAQSFAEMLSIIQDARSGYSWDTFFWSNENYILKSDAYPAKNILERCNKILPVLEEMINSNVESYTLPLPISMQDVLRMMQPHLVQIRDYAVFRLELAELEEDFAKGMETEEISARLYDISEPIKNYNCVIGAWGQIEARAQYEMVTEFAAKAGVPIPMHAAFQKERKDRILSQIIANQKELEVPYYCKTPYYQLGLAYGLEETTRLVMEMVEEGLLTLAEDGSVYLTNWENYKYHFDS